MEPYRVPVWLLSLLGPLAPMERERQRIRKKKRKLAVASCLGLLRRRCGGGRLVGLAVSLLLGRPLLLGGLGGTLGLAVVGRGPEGEVVTEKLHDEGAVAVRLLGEGVELGNGVIKSLLGQVASTVGRVQDLVVKDREVESQTQADGVGRSQLGLGDIGGALHRVEKLVSCCKPCAIDSGNSYLVSLVGSGSGKLALLTRGELGQVAVVVALPVVPPLVSKDSQTDRCAQKSGAKKRGNGPTYILW